MSKVSPKIKSMFLERLERGETVGAIANGLGIRRQSFYRHRLQDEGFREAWIEAALIGAQIQLNDLEKEADRRAMEDSDRLLIFRIKAVARRAGDNSYVERVDATSQDDKIQTGLIVLEKPETDADAWHENYTHHES